MAANAMNIGRVGLLRPQPATWNTTMTDDKMSLRETIGFAAQRLMKLETVPFRGAAFGERSDERLNQSNGYRERHWETRADTVKVSVPKLHHGSHFPGLPGTPAHRGEGPDMIA